MYKDLTESEFISIYSKINLGYVLGCGFFFDLSETEFELSIEDDLIFKADRIEKTFKISILKEEAFNCLSYLIQQCPEAIIVLDKKINSDKRIKRMLKNIKHEWF